jgi:putative PIN family toxin of toxin-antitoxin system
MMRKVVLDTNILVSALWSEKGNANDILELFFREEIMLFYTQDIIDEYEEVLCRARLNFSGNKVASLLQEISNIGFLTEPEKSSIVFSDEDDRVFYDTAKENGAILIIGNKKHYPNVPFVMSPSEFINIRNNYTE